MERDVYEPIHSTDAVSSRVFLVFGKSPELRLAGSEIRNVFSNIAGTRLEHTVLSTLGQPSRQLVRIAERRGLSWSPGKRTRPAPLPDYRPTCVVAIEREGRIGDDRCRSNHGPWWVLCGTMAATHRTWRRIFRTSSVRIEVIKGWLTLKQLDGAVGVLVTPLDGSAKPLGETRGRRLEIGWEIAVGDRALKLSGGWLRRRGTERFGAEPDRAVAVRRRWRW
jgi:hypothetical protein